MRIESALYTSKEGLDAHGQAISVIGDNISNANTVGFKGSRTEFSDLLAGGADSPYPDNLPTSGSGATVQSVRPMIFENGVIEVTGRTLDMAVDGNGFFMVGDPAAPKFTRAGNFEVSRDGYLETAAGDRVLGIQGAGEAAVLGPIDMINVNLNGSPTASASIAGNLSSAAEIAEAPQNPASFGELNQAAAFSASIDVYDSLGASHPLSLYFFKTGAGQWQAQAYVDAGQTGGEAGRPQMVGQTVLNFDETGGLPGEALLNAQFTFSGAQASNISVDLSQMNQFASESSISNVARDGQAAGSISGYEILEDGSVMAKLSSGTSILVGTLQLAKVPNLDGLNRAGDTLFTHTDAAGDLVMGAPGENGLGRLRGQSLERSTVDISKEFVDLVLIQRGYQANAQVLTQTNELLRQAIAMLR